MDSGPGQPGETENDDEDIFDAEGDGALGGPAQGLSDRELRREQAGEDEDVEDPFGPDEAEDDKGDADGGRDGDIEGVAVHKPGTRGSEAKERDGDGEDKEEGGAGPLCYGPSDVPG